MRQSDDFRAAYVTYFSGSQKNYKDKVLDGNNLWGIRDVPTCTQIGMCVQLDAAISTGF